MPLTAVNLGAFPDDGSGDALRTGGAIINANFDLLGAKAVIFASTLDLSGGVRLQPETTLVGTLNIALPGALEPGARCIMRLRAGLITLPPRCILIRGNYMPDRLNTIVFEALEGNSAANGTVTCSIFSSVPTTVTGLYYRQDATTQANLWGDWGLFINTPAATPATAAQYSRLNLLEAQGRASDKHFYFRLKYADGTNIEWRQWSNPLNHYSKVLGYTPILGTGQIAGFGGLSRSPSPFLYMTALPGVADGNVVLRGTLGGTKFELPGSEGQPGLTPANKLAELSIFTP